MSLDANDLILFAQLMEHGSFARTAERAGLPKSTLSRRITALESKLGERLLNRSTRRLTITEFGERVLEHAKRLQEEAEAASAMALHRQDAPRGKLRVSLPPGFAELDLTPFLLRFASSYPEISLELDISPRRVDLIAERFDLAVRVARQLPDDNTLVARPLCELQHALYASPAYLARYGVPATPADLRGHVCLRLFSSSGETMPWHLTRGSERWEGMPDGPLAANSLELQRSLATHGLGIVALADRFAMLWLAQGVLVRVLPAWSLPPMTAWCVTPGRRLLPTRTRVFIDLLTAALASDAGFAPVSARSAHNIIVDAAILPGGSPPAQG